MGGDGARLIATDRPPPFRIENLGSWARLDDRDAMVTITCATPWLQSRASVPLLGATSLSGLEECYDLLAISIL
jgi:hypothetical protein